MTVEGEGCTKVVSFLDDVMLPCRLDVIVPKAGSLELWLDRPRDIQILHEIRSHVSFNIDHSQPR